MTDRSLMQAEQQVEAFISILQRRYGITEQEVPELVENIRWLSGARNGIGKVGWGMAFTLCGIIVSGMAMAAWEGIKLFVHGGPK